VDELKKNNMKKIAYLLIMITTLGVVSCTDDNNDTLTGNKNEGGLITVKKTLVPYVVGNGNDFQYATDISAFQGRVKVTSIDIYKTFTNVSGQTSNSVLLKSITLPNENQVENQTITFTFNELRAGLTINGAPLSTNDASLAIGDFWTLKYVTKTSKGTEVVNLTTTKVAVGTRFAGTYKCITGQYWRIGVLSATESSWPAATTIESVNSTTYRVVNYFGLFSGNEFYFTMDSNDIISYPPTTPAGVGQSGNGQPFITCQSNPGDMTQVNCNNSNYATRDNVGGKDRLYMSFGYYTPNSGPRAFYQVMEKIVD
jgi:hypothetical protein